MLILSKPAFDHRYCSDGNFNSRALVRGVLLGQFQLLGDEADQIKQEIVQGGMPVDQPDTSRKIRSGVTPWEFGGLLSICRATRSST